jgi:hypothetical protein
MNWKGTGHGPVKALPKSPEETEEDDGKSDAEYP